MPRLAVLVSTATLLVGPTALAFFSGGYFDGPRATAAVIAWALVLLLAIAGPLPLPTSRAGRLAIAALAGLAVWSAVSIAWAPLVGPALDSVERILLYVAVLLAGVAVLRDRRAARAVEPVLALGAVVAIGYGLAGRLLPGMIDLISARSYGAGGRLEQPITYWNAEGLLAGIGLLLCVRVAGDRSRPGAMRALAAAGCAPLGAGIYLSYSRGALAVTALGLIVLLAAAPAWPQLRAAVTGVVAGGVAAACSSVFPGVASLTGTSAEQQRDGAIMLTLLVAIMLGAALLSVHAARSERNGAARLGWLPHARRLPAVAVAAAALCVAGLVAGGLSENRRQSESAAPTASRFASVSSVRYEYWRVGLLAFSREPVQGLGAGGFRVFWRMERRVPHSVTEVHSLPLEMAGELGVPGLLLFLTFVGGVAVAGRRALRQGAPLAPAATAVTTAWLLHATIDWDWQLPAVTAPVLVLAAGLLAASEQRLPGAAPADWVAAEAAEEPPVTVAAS
jgi:O-antigen ligase/polysaccharide polymerase Wzy-like membrane protein